MQCFLRPLFMFAIVDIAGFQEKVEEGMKLSVPLLGKEAGESVVFDHVLLVSRSKEDVQIGKPYVAGASVTARVIATGKDDKVIVYKMKHRKRYRRTQGHRQGNTSIEITGIKA